MTEDEQSRLDAIESQLREAHARIAALTSRVYQLETGGKAPQPIHEQPAIVVVPEPPAPTEDWESMVGTNWMNRIGVLLLVIGITLFLSYAMTYLGPAGKIAIGISVGAALLATGYWYEHKGNFRPFSLGMLAGGFAILYATAFASYAIEASRVIHNPYIGMLVQIGVALAALWQATQYESERAASLGLLAAYLSLAQSPKLAFTYIGCYPLTLGGLYLCQRMGWRYLPWGILFSTWTCEVSSIQEDWEFQYFGRPIAWLNLALFTAIEIRQRLTEVTMRSPLLLAVNAVYFLLATFGETKFTHEFHAAGVFGLLTLCGLASNYFRQIQNIRGEALAEILTLIAASLALIARFGAHDVLLLTALLILLSAAAAYRSATAPPSWFTPASEFHLALISFTTLAIFLDSRMIYTHYVRVREGLPHALLLMVVQFAVGRWASVTPWPSWAGLLTVAIVTLATIPETGGTIVLALEAILALAIGMRLDRRPIRLGAIALFVFAIGKVFFYDLANLDTLPRIFSFIVLGLLLIGASWAYTRFREHLQKYL